eukprot:COSAG02_NODE_144_length_34086_cov_65.390944_31_plen_209_part_00
MATPSVAPIGIDAPGLVDHGDILGLFFLYCLHPGTGASGSWMRSGRAWSAWRSCSTFAILMKDPLLGARRTGSSCPWTTCLSTWRRPPQLGTGKFPQSATRRWLKGVTGASKGSYSQSAAIFVTRTAHQVCRPIHRLKALSVSFPAMYGSTSVPDAHRSQSCRNKTRPNKVLLPVPQRTTVTTCIIARNLLRYPVSQFGNFLSLRIPL